MWFSPSRIGLVVGRFFGDLLRYSMFSTEHVAATDLTDQPVISENRKTAKSCAQEFLRQVDDVHVCVDGLDVRRHEVSDRPSPVAVISGVQRDLEAVRFRQHADEFTLIVDNRRSRNAMLHELVQCIEHIHIGFECNKLARHVASNQC